MCIRDRNNDFYRTLKSRWYSEHPEYIQRCILTCGDKGSYLVNKQVLAKEQNASRQ